MQQTQRVQQSIMQSLGLLCAVQPDPAQPSPAQPSPEDGQRKSPSVWANLSVSVSPSSANLRPTTTATRAQMLMLTANDADDGQESNATVQFSVVSNLGLKPTMPSQAADGDRDGATWCAAAASLVRWGRSCHRDERCVGCDAKRVVCDPRRRRLSDWVGCPEGGRGFTSRSCRHRR
ncbi:hypothetical protein IWZ03DRAFT_373455 [Phyllosticta citriasiana]|uniref:Uncharacterized protein n=1 Tax=Phyllosticta citriasiana TaxID=595635 RepID=A0ABR1KSZ3_9PEZI